MPEPFLDLPILDEVGEALSAAFLQIEADEALEASVARRAAPPRRPRRWRLGRSRPLPTIVVALLLGGLGAGTATATLTVLRGTPIPSPRAIDLQAAMTARASTQSVGSLRSAATTDAREPSFAIRTGKSETGLACATVGEVSGGRAFGLTGTDGVFRAMPPTVVDGCGAISGRGAAVAGARVFDAARPADVRTVVYGIGGPKLRSASAVIRGRSRPVPVRDGTFLLALRGYREDSAPQVTLRFDGGRAVTYPAGGGAKNIVDPTGPAWSIDVGTVGPSYEDTTTLCVWMERARPTATSPRTAPVCGAAQRGGGGVTAEPFFVGIQRFAPGASGGGEGRFSWKWRNAPARTMVMGYARLGTVRSVTVTAPGFRSTTPPKANGAFAVVMPGSIAPNDVRVAITSTSGAVQHLGGPTNIVIPQEAPR